VVVVLTRRGGGRKQTALKVALAGTLFMVVVGGAIIVGGESSLSRFVETAQSKDISTNRFYIWTVTTRVIGANLPFGAGLGALGVAFTPFDTNSGLERVEQAHNDYLQTLSDAGLIGLLIGVVFFSFLIATGSKAVRTENHSRRGIAIGALAGCIAVLVHSAFDFVLHTTAISMLFLILLGLTVAAGRKYPDDVRNEKHAHRRRKGTVTEIAKVRHVGELEG
jgi:O-antigen ligase